MSVFVPTFKDNDRIQEHKLVSKLVDRSRGRPEGSLFVSYYLSVGVGATPIPGFYTTYPRFYP